MSPFPRSLGRSSRRTGVVPGDAAPAAGLTVLAVRLAAAALLLVGGFPAPALAAPVGVTGMTYDETQRLITIGIAGSVSVRTQRIKHPDRLVIDLSEARLPLGQPVPIVQVKSTRIRSIRIGQNSFVPAVVRVVVDLMPGFEPMVKISQPGGKLMITLANPAPPQGERDLESLPGLPASAPLRPAPIVPDAPVPPLPEPERITRLPAPAASPTPRPAAPRPAAPASTPAPGTTASDPAPKPQWTPPPVPGWVPKPSPASREPISGPPVSGPPASSPRPSAPSASGQPVSGQPVSGQPVSGQPVVIIPADVRPASPAPTAPPDPFSPWPAPASRPQSETPKSAEPASADPPAAAESVLPPDRLPSKGHGSTFQLRWQQIETLEEYGGPAPSFAYPAGLNGFDLEHWFMPYLGAGLDARVLFYDLTVESVRQHRTDAALGSFVTLRYPFAFLEPSLRAGYMGRMVTVESESTGTTFPFSPLQTYYGPTLTGKLKVSLLPGFGLDLHGKLFPGTQGALYPGFPAIFPLAGRGWGASLVTDVMQGYVSLGYTMEQAASADGTFTQTFSGITLGAGLRY